MNTDCIVVILFTELNPDTWKYDRLFLYDGFCVQSSQWESVSEACWVCWLACPEWWGTANPVSTNFFLNIYAHIYPQTYATYTNAYAHMYAHIH